MSFGIHIATYGTLLCLASRTPIMKRFTSLVVKGSMKLFLDE